jgi:hypothetical protein
MHEDAAQVQRVEITGLSREDLPIQRLGIVQLPALMMHGRAPKHVEEGGIS